jgi:hypothetical protein
MEGARYSRHPGNMKKLKPYHYRNPRVAPPDYTTENVLRAGDQEVLSGNIHGMKASDLEERVARALDRLEIGYEFRARLTSDALGRRELTNQFANIRGEIEIDFVCERGQTTPIFVDGQIAHFMTPHQADVDKEKENATNEFGRRLGWREAVRIPFWKLLDQAMTDRTIRDIFV